jgi:hypothetical protein
VLALLIPLTLLLLVLHLLLDAFGYMQWLQMFQPLRLRLLLHSVIKYNTKHYFGAGMLLAPLTHLKET